MSERKNNIDKIFSRKLRHWVQEPPSEVWDNIRSELDLGRKKKRIAWIARIAASVAVVTVLSLSYVLIRYSFNRNLVSEEQTSADSVLKETEQVIPVYSDLGDKDEKKPAIKENTFDKKTYQAEKQTMDEKNEILAEVSVLIPEKQRDSEVLDQPDDISGSSRPGSDLAYLEMNFIFHLDYYIPQRERKPEQYTQSDDLPVLTEPTADANWDESYVQNLPDQEDKIENRWAVGTQVSPIYSYRTLGVQETAMQSDSYYDQIESGLIAYSGGVNVKYFPTKRISIQSGIYYSKLGLSVDNNYYFDNNAPATFGSSSVFKSNSVSNSSGIINVENNSPVNYITNSDENRQLDYFYSGISALNVSVYEGEIIQNFEYLEVPMIIRYKIIDRKLDFNFLGGLSTNFLIGSNAYFLEDKSKEKIGKTTDIKPVNYSSILGFGVGYSISKRLNINLEPTFRYYLNSINVSSSIRSHPYSVGIFTGLSFYF